MRQNSHHSWRQFMWLRTHVKISQLVNKMCSQQACSKLVLQVVTMLLFYQVATRLSLTTCWQIANMSCWQVVGTALLYKSAAGLLQLVCFYVLRGTCKSAWPLFLLHILYPTIFIGWFIISGWIMFCYPAYSCQ
jgi:hypothetical protein